MWLDWLVFCDCGFQSPEKNKRLMEASRWERLTEGETGPCSDESCSSGSCSVPEIQENPIPENYQIGAETASGCDCYCRLSQADDF